MENGESITIENQWHATKCVRVVSKSTEKKGGEREGDQNTNNNL